MLLKLKIKKLFGLLLNYIKQEKYKRDQRKHIAKVLNGFLELHTVSLKVKWVERFVKRLRVMRDIT